MKTQSEIKQSKLERCGFCGRYFIEDKYLSEEEIKTYTNKELEEAPLGYCPEANYEDPNAPQERIITRDMSTDACMPELEGTRVIF